MTRSPQSSHAPSPLDVLYPFAGPCLICGGPDKRHRMADTIVGNVRAGDSPALVARDYGIPVASVHALVATANRNRRRHKARWSA